DRGGPAAAYSERATRYGLPRIHRGRNVIYNLWVRRAIRVDHENNGLADIGLEPALRRCSQESVLRFKLATTSAMIFGGFGEHWNAAVVGLVETLGAFTIGL